MAAPDDKIAQTVVEMKAFASSAADSVVAAAVSGMEAIANIAVTGAAFSAQGTRKPDTINSKAYDFEKFHYPHDLLGANNKYGGNYVVFYINVQQDSQLSANKDASNGDIVPPDIAASSSGLNSDVKASTTIGDTARGAVAVSAGTSIAKLVNGDLLGTAESIGGAAVKGTIGILGTAALIKGMSTQVSRATKRLKSAIALHIPNQLVASYGIQWEGADTARDQMANMNFGGIGGVNVMATIAAVSGLNELKNKDFLSAQTGMAANSKKEMLFKGVDFRTFNFEYKFTPRNVDELALVENIIQMFKFHMHPEHIQNTGSFLYLYPSEFDILYYHEGQENQHIHKHTSCVLSNMSVQYTPNGNFTAFANGAATEIHVTLTFNELAQLTKQEIANGY